MEQHIVEILLKLSNKGKCFCGMLIKSVSKNEENYNCFFQGIAGANRRGLIEGRILLQIRHLVTVGKGIYNGLTER